MSLTFHASNICKPRMSSLWHDKADALVLAVFTSALWAICHPYSGIIGDSTVYMGRIVANLDPGGVGRDLMFVNDGQSKFSLFPILAQPLVAVAGVSNAALIIAALGSACWFGALLCIAFSLASKRSAWVIVIVLSVLPVSYGDNAIFSFAETAALPRPFAEAAVLVAISALLCERIWVCVLFLLLATALHPLMALPGIGVAFAAVLWHMPSKVRAFICVGSLSVLICAVILGCEKVYLFDRLVAVIDAEWMAMLLQRSPHLFPTHWVADAFGPIIAQAATILVATRFLPEAQRQVFISLFVVVAGGLGVAAICSDKMQILLFVQIQTWRVTWLLAALAGCALAYCAPLLWYRDNIGRLVLACLIFLWFAPTDPLISLAAAIAVIILEFARFRVVATDRIVVLAYVIVGIFIAIGAVIRLAGYIDYLSSYPRDLPHLVDPLRNNMHTIPILFLTAAWFLRGPQEGTKALAIPCLAGIVLSIVTVEVWDQRFPVRSYFETPHLPPNFADLARGRPQEVFWVDARGEPWFMMGRPQYLSPQQAVSIVFSRPLAMEWRRRAERLVDLGLAQKQIFSPADPAEDDDHLHISQQGVDQLCREPSPPGVIVIPLQDDTPRPELRGMLVWPLPETHYVFDRYRSGNRWHTIRNLGVVICPGQAA